MNLNAISSLLKVIQSSDAKTAATLTKLLDIEVLKSLGENRYLLQAGGKELTALSQQKLIPHEHYLARFEVTKNSQPTLSHLLKVPKLFTKLPLLDSALLIEPKELARLLSAKEGVMSFKESLLKELVSSPSKEHFQALSPFLLSLHQNVLSIPLYFFDTYALLQFKKRYNKKTKESFLDFYAFFTHLGALSGIVSQNEARINVAFEETKRHLETLRKKLGYEVQIEVSEMILPLYETKEQKILDITT